AYRLAMAEVRVRLPLGTSDARGVGKRESAWPGTRRSPVRIRPPRYSFDRFVVVAVGSRSYLARMTTANSQKVMGWRRATKWKVIRCLGGRCNRCGYDRCTEALEFHHRDPATQERGIGMLL